MIRAEMEGAGIAMFSRLVRGGLKPSMAKAALLLAQEAAGDLAEVVMERLAKNPTGSLARSFNARLVVNTDEVVAAEAASRSKYARIQDEGGTIRPRRRKALAIPLPGRVPRGMGPREFPQKLFPVKGVLAMKAGDSIIPVFALKKSVKITGVGYVAEALSRLLPRIGDVVGGELAKNFTTAAGSVPRRPKKT